MNFLKQSIGETGNFILPSKRSFGLTSQIHYFKGFGNLIIRRHHAKNLKGLMNANFAFLLIVAIGFIFSSCQTISEAGKTRQQTKTFINSNVQAKVYRDGSYIGTTPMEIVHNPDRLFYQGGGKITYEFLGKTKNKRIHKQVFVGTTMTILTNILTPVVGHLVDFISGAGFYNIDNMEYTFNIRNAPPNQEFVYWNYNNESINSLLPDYEILGEGRKTYTTYTKPKYKNTDDLAFTGFNSADKTVLGLTLKKRYKPFNEKGYPLTQAYTINFGTIIQSYKKCRWTGSFDNANNPDGYGTAYFEDGSYYQGIIKNNKPNGYGIFKTSYIEDYTSKCDQISGNWVDGYLNGVGITSFNPYLPLGNIPFTIKYITGEYANSTPKGVFYILNPNNEPVGETSAINGNVTFNITRMPTTEEVTNLLIKGGVLVLGAITTVVVLNMGDIPSHKLNESLKMEPTINLDDPIIDSKNCTEKRTYYSMKSSEGEVYKGIFKEKSDDKNVWHVDRKFYESNSETIAGVLLIFPMFTNDDAIFYSLLDLKTYMIKLIKDKKK